MQTTMALRFNRLIELNYLPLFRFAALLYGSPETALTLTHRTFPRAHARTAQPAAPADAKRWLLTLLLLEFLKHRPRHHPRKTAQPVRR